MDESYVEMDSFTAEMLKKIEKHKKLFNNLENNNDDNENNENEEEDVKIGSFEQQRKLKETEEEEDIENIADESHGDNNDNGEDNGELEEDDDELEEEEDEEDDELLNDDYYCNNNVVNQVRESVSYLLNVRKSLLSSDVVPSSITKTNDNNKVDSAVAEDHDHDDEDNDDNCMKSEPNSRLNRRLNKISMFYEDDDNGGTTTTATRSSKQSILTEVNSNLDARPPIRKLKLQDRLKEIASSYYPTTVNNSIQDDDIGTLKTKISSNTDELKSKSESAIIDSCSSTSKNKPSTSNQITEPLFKSKSVAYDKVVVQPKPPTSKFEKPVVVSSSSTSSKFEKPEASQLLTKKTSVADLTKLFESKSKEEEEPMSQAERPPELLTLREKRRLFERAIKSEQEASSKQYRGKFGGVTNAAQKRPIQTTVVTSNVASTSPQPESKNKRQKSSSDVFEVEEESKIIKKKPQEDQHKEERQEDQHKEEHQEDQHKEERQEDQHKEERQEDQHKEERQEDQHKEERQEDQLKEEHEDVDIDEEHENSDRDIGESVGQAFKTIDNFSIDDDSDDNNVEDNNSKEEEPFEQSAVDMDITFSTLDSNQLLVRSSTRTNLVQHHHEKIPEVDEEDLEEDAPEKPPRTFLYPKTSSLGQIFDENEVRELKSSEVSESKSSVPEPMIDEAPLRTISFYRREQKMKKECPSLSSADNPMDQDGTNVVYLKQHLDDQQDFDESDLIQFKEDLVEKIHALKAEINEHNRISTQASTALNMCLSVPDLVNSTGRIEAERLLLISAEKRAACLSEVNRLKLIVQNPVKHFHELSGPPGSKGTVVINNLRIPLRNDFVVSRSKGKASNFYFLCMVCNGPKIFISELLNTEKNLGNEFLEFKFGLNVTELDEKFCVLLKLFSFELHPQQQHQSSSSKHNHDGGKKPRFKKSFKDSLKLSAASPMKKLTHLRTTTSGSGSGSGSVSTSERSTDSPIPKSMTTSISSNFKQIGHVKLTLSNVRQAPKYYPLESFSINHPLDGYLTMNVSLKVSHHYTAQGFFDIQDTETSFWNLRWFVIRANFLYYWRFPADAENGLRPLGMVNLKNCINPAVSFLKSEQRHLCMRPNTFVLVTIQPPSISNATKLIKGGTITKPVPQIYFISSQSKEDSSIFSQHINRAIHNIRTWEIDAVRPYSNDEFDRLLLSSN